jgi:hypothetical protein
MQPIKPYLPSNIRRTGATPLAYMIRFMFKDGLPVGWGKKL